jgi:hypothetical protein
MRMIHTLSVQSRVLRTRIVRTLLAAICVLPAAYHALAQEGAPAAGDGTAPAPDKAAAANRDVEPFTPQRGPAGLQRRANLKALVENARSNAAGLPPANLRTVAPAQLRPAMQAAPPRNAIGAAVPGVQSPGRGITTPAANGSAGIGAPAGSVARMTYQAPLPKAVQMPRGTGINGTAMVRAASSAGSIGGPAKDRSGINGNLTAKH